MLRTETDLGRFFIFIALTFSINTGFCLAASPVKELSTSELKKIQSSFQKIKHLSVNYTQSFYNPFRKTTRKFEGTAQFSAPNKFLWNRKKPKELIYYDGKDLIIYNPVDRVASRFSALGSKAQEVSRLAKIILNPNKFLDTYAVQSSLLDEKSKTLSLELQPKQKNDLDHISVVLDLKALYLQKLSLFYRDGKIMNYVFSNPERKNIDQSIYKFDKPKGVKLVVFD